METQKKTIVCDCGNTIDTSENPVIAICPECNRHYQKQPPQLKLLGVQADMLNGIVII